MLNFYDRVKTDTTTGFIFNDIDTINWEQHLPIIADYLGTILLDNPVYKKNAMEVHYALNKILPLNKKIFKPGLLYFLKVWMNIKTAKMLHLLKHEQAK